MNEPLIPILPDTAPFTREQRAYLNGFFAGLYSRSAAPQGSPQDAPLPALVPLTILFGSQTGNAETLARRIAKEAGKRAFAPTIHDLGKYALHQLAGERALLLITSTFGDGDPPDNAKAFWEALKGGSAPGLAELRFSVCALGDSTYPRFCEFGKRADERLQKLGGLRVHPRADCDVDFETPFAAWLEGALSALATADAPRAVPFTATTPPTTIPTAKTGTYSRAHPFPAPLLFNRRLNGEGSAKDTRHLAFGLADSGLAYEAGDALGVRPTNCPRLADEVTTALHCSGDEPVPGRDGAETTLREALVRDYELTRIPQALLQSVADQSGDKALQGLLAPGTNGELAKYLHGREIVDLLGSHPSVSFAPRPFVALLRKLQPRLYSIASSLKAHPGEVHLCVGVVRYESLGRPRQGVCSTYLSDRVPDRAAVPVFVHQNKNFRLPPDPDTPIIMVGPDTGIAPFRAFLEERRTVGAGGANWLFFGDQRAATDFLFREELEAMQREGVLSRMDVAFSRDQAAKVYVQDRMREYAREIFEWLEEGAAFYVCGDASRMAKDVDAALHELVGTAGGMSPEQSAGYVAALKKARRYQRDVY